MLRNIALAFVAVLASASVAFANPAVYGNWAAQQHDNGFTFTIMLSVAAQQSTLGAKCEYGGQAVVVSATVPSEVTDTQLVLKGSASETKKVGGLDCSVNVQPMAFDYQLSGDTLVLSVDGQQLPLSRVK